MLEFDDRGLGELILLNAIYNSMSQSLHIKIKFIKLCVSFMCLKSVQVLLLLFYWDQFEAFSDTRKEIFVKSGANRQLVITDNQINLESDK